MTKPELYEQIKLDYSSKYNIPVSNLGDKMLADCAVMATMMYSLYLRINTVAPNIWPGSSDVQTLLSVGFDKLGRIPFPAVSGIYNCQTVATTGITPIVLNTQFKKGDYIYETLSEVAPDDTVQIRALSAGTESLLAVSDELTSVSPLTSVNDVITVLSVDTAPSDSELIEDYRIDVVNSFKLRPNGGNASDYILWAADVSDIRTVYPYAADGEAGKIKVYCEGVSTFIPISAKIDEVIDAIKYDSEGICRVLVDLFPFITDEYIIHVQITNVNIILTGGNLSQQSQAEQIIEDYLYNIRPYLPTLNKTRDPNTDTISQQGIIKALSDGGITFTSMTLKVKPLGGTEQIVSSYQVGNANDPTKYGEIGTLESLTIS